MSAFKQWLDTYPLIAYPTAFLIIALYEFMIIRYFFRNSIQQVIGYLRRFATEELNFKYLTAVVVLATTGTIFYYGFPWAASMRRSLYDDPRIYLFYFTAFSIAFAGAYLLYPATGRPAPFLRNPKFWILLFVSVAVFAFRMSSISLYAEDLMREYNGTPNQQYWTRIMLSLKYRMPSIVGSVFIIWLIKDRRKMPFYGFTRKNFDLRPYVGMLFFMLPLIFMAATTSDFLDSYPRAGGWGLQHLSVNNPEHQNYFLLFETIYGLDFINVELFFRGLLILAFMEFAGPKAILPASAFYVFIHFGKPLGETISSFFGGTLLGIIAYYSRSILGGIIVHMGIAWLMELMAFLFLMLL